MTPKSYGLVAAAVAAAMSFTELIRLVATRGVATGIPFLTTDVVSLALISVLALAAIGLARGRLIGWQLGAAAAVVAVAHAVMSVSLGARLPVIYIPGGFLMLLLLGKSAVHYRPSREPEPSRRAVAPRAA